MREGKRRRVGLETVGDETCLLSPSQRLIIQDSFLFFFFPFLLLPRFILQRLLARDRVLFGRMTPSRGRNFPASLPGGVHSGVGLIAAIFS